MRRFTKLTRHGAPCYVDPALVGVVGVESRDAIYVTLCDRDNHLLLDRVEEGPDEVYRRLAAAGQVVTKEDVDNALDSIDTALVGSLDRVRRGLWDAPTEATAKLAMTEALRPFREAVKALSQTVLRALYVSAGEEPPNV